MNIDFLFFILLKLYDPLLSQLERVWPNLNGENEGFCNMSGTSMAHARRTPDPQSDI